MAWPQQLERYKWRMVKKSMAHVLQNFVVCLVFGFWLVGCGHHNASTSAQHSAMSPGTKGAPSAQEAKSRYQKITNAIERGAWSEATGQINQIKAQFPYSPYSVLAELREADIHKKQGQYVEAIETYRAFLRFHPGHDEAAYALFEVGECYFHEIPKNWWFMPKAAEKDQASIRQAIAAYDELLARFDAQAFWEQARPHRDEARRKLAEHEMVVARFYFDKEHMQGAIQRAQGVLDDYPGLGLDSEALWLLGRAYTHEGNVQKARSCLTTLMQTHPDSPFALKARPLLHKSQASKPFTP